MKELRRTLEERKKQKHPFGFMFVILIRSIAPTWHGDIFNFGKRAPGVFARDSVFYTILVLVIIIKKRIEKEGGN